MKIKAFMTAFLSLALVLPTKPQNLGDHRENLIQEIDSKSWYELLEERPYEYRPPYTINLLIQPVHSPSWIYVNPSMAVSRRYVSTGLTNNVEKTRVAKHQEDMVMQFAFDDPAFMPDFRLTNIHLADGKYPVATADYFANDLYYKIEYSACQLQGTQNALGVKIEIKNEGYVDKTANVRVKLGYYPEDEIFDYHYMPYWWDNTKWKPYDKISMSGYDILKEGKNIGQVVPEGMTIEWEKKKEYSDEDYDDLLYPQVWFGSGFVLMQYRLKDIQDVIHASKPLKPGESTHFSIKLLVDDTDNSQFGLLASLKPEDIKDKALEGFRKEFSDDAASMSFDKDKWSDRFTALQLSIKQMLLEYPNVTGWQTAQGGSSERFGVWVFEAVTMLRPMIRTGQLTDVRKGLDFIFSLQDSGCPPAGRFTTTEGAVGTTGPRWANTTGMALILASEYYEYTHDEDFLNVYLPKVMKAIHWIVGEIKATRKLNADGSRPLTYGIMPYAVGCDADTGFCLSDTDVMTFWGFRKAVEMLEYINHPEAPELLKELSLYHEDLLYVIDHLTHENGFIDRIVPIDGVRQQIQPKFDITDSMIPMVMAGIMREDSQTYVNYMNFCEKNYSAGEFLGGLDREIMYTNQCEHNWQQIYLRLGQWKKAFFVTHTNLRYGMSQDAFQTSERISLRNPAFAPWQPNGSANGRIIDMMLNAFYFENGKDTATVLGCMPFQWIRDNGGAEVRNILTMNGKVCVKVSPSSKGKYSLKISSDGPLPSVVRIPEHLNASPVSHNVSKAGEGWFKVRRGCPTAEFRISE